MKCLHCQGKMEKKTASFNINRDNYHLTLDSVPAWVCQQCGEPYFEEKEVEKIQKMISLVDQESKHLFLANQTSHEVSI